MRFILIILILPFLGCNSQQEQNQKKEKDLQSQILKLHDKVMPQMENIINREQLLSQKMKQLAEIKKLHPGIDTAAFAARLSLSINHLQAVDHNMMDWMHNLDMNFENKSHQQIMNYLNEQYAKIKVVDKGMKTSFSEADSLIKEIK